MSPAAARPPRQMRAHSLRSLRAHGGGGLWRVVGGQRSGVSEGREREKDRERTRARRNNTGPGGNELRQVGARYLRTLSWRTQCRAAQLEGVYESFAVHGGSHSTVTWRSSQSATKLQGCRLVAGGTCVTFRRFSGLFGLTFRRSDCLNGIALGCHPSKHREMPRQASRKYPLPKGWPACVKTALLDAVAFGRLALLQVAAGFENSPLPRAQYAAKTCR
jgi:hypothetical protein